jgi:hypothetical protein
MGDFRKMAQSAAITEMKKGNRVSFQTSGGSFGGGYTDGYKKDVLKITNAATRGFKMTDARKAEIKKILAKLINPSESVDSNVAYLKWYYKTFLNGSKKSTENYNNFGKSEYIARRYNISEGCSKFKNNDSQFISCTADALYNNSIVGDEFSVNKFNPNKSVHDNLKMHGRDVLPEMNVKTTRVGKKKKYTSIPRTEFSKELIVPTEFSKKPKGRMGQLNLNPNIIRNLRNILVDGYDSDLADSYKIPEGMHVMLMKEHFKALRDSENDEDYLEKFRMRARDKLAKIFFQIIKERKFDKNKKGDRMSIKKMYEIVDEFIYKNTAFSAGCNDCDGECSD